MEHFISQSPEQTQAIAYAFGKNLPTGSIVCFYGDLAAGKTTFIKGLVAGATDLLHENVNSPTFVYLNIYEGKRKVFHFDLYRLRDEEEFLSMGFEEFFFAEGICCIEWSERIPLLLPPHCVRVSMKHMNQKEDVQLRSIHISKNFCPR